LAFSETPKMSFVLRHSRRLQRAMTCIRHAPSSHHGACWPVAHALLITVFIHDHRFFPQLPLPQRHNASIQPQMPKLVDVPPPDDPPAMADSVGDPPTKSDSEGMATVGRRSDRLKGLKADGDNHGKRNTPAKTGREPKLTVTKAKSTVTQGASKATKSPARKELSAEAAKPPHKTKQRGTKKNAPKPKAAKKQPIRPKAGRGGGNGPRSSTAGRGRKGSPAAQKGGDSEEFSDDEVGSRKRKKKEAPSITQAKKHLMTVAAAKKAAATTAPALSGDSSLSVPGKRDDSSDEDDDMALARKIHSRKDQRTGDSAPTVESAPAVESDGPALLPAIPVDSGDCPDAGKPGKTDKRRSKVMLTDPVYDSSNPPPELPMYGHDTAGYPTLEENGQIEYDREETGYNRIFNYFPDDAIVSGNVTAPYYHPFKIRYGYTDDRGHVYPRRYIRDDLSEFLSMFHYWHRSIFDFDPFSALTHSTGSL